MSHRGVHIVTWTCSNILVTFSQVGKMKLLAVATSQRRLAAHEAHWRGPGMIQNEFNKEKNNIFNEET